MEDGGGAEDGDMSGCECLMGIPVGGYGRLLRTRLESG